MPRTKFSKPKKATPKNPPEEQPIYDSKEDPILISYHTFKLIQKQKKPENLLLLYVFYYSTAKWQSTNQPWATAKYVCKGLRWSKDRVHRTKKHLEKLGLIQSVVRRSTKKSI